MRKLIGLCAVLTALLTSGAFADLTSMGDPFEGGSWGQRFQEDGVGNFDFLVIKSVSGSTFEAPAFRNFTYGSWSGVTSPTLTLANASGPALNWIQFDIMFNDPRVPTVFDFYAFVGPAHNRLEATRATYNGGWSFTRIQAPLDFNQLVVPVPAAVLLGMLGLGVAGLKLRKFA